MVVVLQCKNNRDNAPSLFAACAVLPLEAVPWYTTLQVLQDDLLEGMLPKSPLTMNFADKQRNYSAPAYH